MTMSSNRESGGRAVLVFCPNLAVDHVLQTDGLLIGHAQRVKSGSSSAGGKGLNFARAAGCIGMRATVIGFVGGRAGAMLRSLADAENIEVVSPHFTYETRIVTIVRDQASCTTTVLNEPGPAVSAHDWAILINLVKVRLADASALICTGSLPPGISPDAYVELIEAGREVSIPVIVDASAETLRSSADAGPGIIKVNLAEAESALGIRAGGGRLKHRASESAKRLQRMSNGAVVVTISLGAALVDGQNKVFLRAPQVTLRNEVGAGDSFLAGLVAGLLHGDDMVTAGKRGVAVASASVETLRPGWLDGQRAGKLEEAVVIEAFD